MERLRTLLVYCHLKKEDCHILKINLSKSTNLRVLDLSHVNLEKEPPHAISTLLHLRTLNLAYTGIEVFPKSFCRLFHLRILNIEGCELRELPKEFNQLTNLHFLNAHHKIIFGIHGIGKLKRLQSLSRFSVRNKEGFRLTELKGINEIDGCLGIENLNEVSDKEEASEAKLKEKKFLRRLEFVWEFQLGPSRDDMNILEGLKPHVNIEELVIDNYGGNTFMGWIVENHSFTNLHFICLRRSKLAVLPNLGQLPSLTVLKIESLDYITHIDDQMYGNGTDIFPSLKELSLSSMSNWVEWSGAQASRFMTCLKKLSITKCENLRGIPFQSLSPSVMELEISNCGQFVDQLHRYIQRLTAITTLKISMCKQRISIPSCNLRLLEYLSLHFCDHVHFVGGLKSLVKLKKLEISNCMKLDESLRPEGQYRELGLTSLIYLEMDCLNHFCIDMLGSLPFLRVLKISGYILGIEHWFRELISLEEFKICWNHRLPSDIESLPSLKKLTISKCPTMDSLPINGLPQSLKELYVIECSKKLIDRFRHSGEDRPKIAHIPYIRIDGETIQML
ncbi:hypothetical protein LUZ60_010743 [Juncus effusus]|nr:hypothetical protein LUZ60_010743 [Juncus effusus]